MGIKRPPALTPLAAISGEQMEKYHAWARVLDDKGRYLPWDEFQFRVKGADPVLAWSFTRRARSSAMQFIDYANEQGQQAGFNKTSRIDALCEQVDKYTTAQALNQQHERLQGIGVALSQLQFDEAITSSQLEGANTTTLIARNMLATGRKPRTESEQMIVGNARLMAEISAHLAEPLTPALIRHFHAVGMAGIDDAKYTPGDYRITDDIVIADYDGNIVHQPPAASQIAMRLEKVCHWVNNRDVYVHPLIRACSLHFMIAHEHPFRDGNGRTSRALFYWYMLKSGYDVFRYISISRLLYAAPVKYAHSYQHTETDNMDLTYFLDYQADIISRAINHFYKYIESLIRRRVEMDQRLFASGAISRLSQRQVTLFNIMLAQPGMAITAARVCESLGVSDNTARNDLRALVREGLVEERKINGQLTEYVARGYS
ncbi:Fic family protein [Kosakonia sp. H02]|nr:Fic family protein [Kosakonia sp. H02]